MLRQRCRTTLGFIALACLIGAGFVVAGQWAPSILHGESLPYSSVVMAGASALLIGIALAVRARRGPARSVETALLSASLPTFVLAVAVIGWRLETGYDSMPDPLLDAEAAWDFVGAAGRWSEAAAMGVTASFLASATILLDWDRWTKSWPRALGALGLASMIVAIVVLPDSYEIRDDVLSSLAHAFGSATGAIDGVRMSLHASASVTLLAIVLLLAGRTSSPARMRLAVLLAGAAACVACHPEALLNQSPGFRCFQEPLGAASRLATVEASYAATCLVGVGFAGAVLGAVGWGLMRRGRARLLGRQLAWPALIATIALVPSAVTLVYLQQVSIAPLAAGAPEVTEGLADILVPTTPVSSPWRVWRSEYRSIPVIADLQGVRTARDSLSWAELQTSAGQERLAGWIPATRQARRFREPRAIRLYADRRLPMTRIAALLEAGELDGAYLRVSSPARSSYEGLVIADREISALTVWAGSFPQQRDGQRLYEPTEEQIRDRSWLSPGRILIDRPGANTSLGVWVLQMCKRASQRGARLVMLDSTQAPSGLAEPRHTPHP